MFEWFDPSPIEAFNSGHKRTLARLQEPEPAGEEAAAAIQGIVAYYYGHFHRGGAKQNYVELDVCRYNQIGADMIFRKNGDSQGQCKKFARNPGEEFDCTDCRNTDMR